MKAPKNDNQPTDYIKNALANNFKSCKNFKRNFSKAANLNFQ